MKKIIASFILLVVLASCSEDIKDMKMGELFQEGFSGQNVKEKLSKQLTSDEHEIYSAGAKRLLFSDSENFKNMTVGDVIENQRVYTAEIKRQQEEIQQQLDKLNSMVGFKIVKKSYYSQSYDNYNALEIEISNNTEKTISGVKASVLVNNMYDDKVQNLAFSYDKEIKSKQKITSEFMWDCNRYDDESMELKNTKTEKLKFVFSTVMILFNDGTKEKLPE
ncbi:MAG: hypothetical protein PF588_09565 [Candidatus Kapabacteria bacterium]|jgi:hypothetical protein|nr:hypothetical protein [Candidatus Kapabacteria bacterium]